MKIGFIGLGNIGQPMATRIASAGFPVTVHDLCQEKAQPLVDLGATWADSPDALAEQCEVICTSLPGPTEFENVITANQGVVATARPHTIVVDFTTNSAVVIRRCHDALANIQVGLLDAPVSGGVEGAMRGQLTILASGDGSDFARIHPVLDAVAQQSIYLGEIGTASVCKALHNCAVFCTNLAMMECLTVGVKAGIDAKKLIEVFQSSGLGRNLDLQVALPATLFQGNFAPRFAMKTALKDMGLATELTESLGVPTTIIDHCAREMTEAVERGWGDQDNTVFLTLQEQRAGTKVRIQ